MSAAPVANPREDLTFLKVMTRYIFDLAGTGGKNGVSKVSSEKQLLAIVAILGATLGKSRKPGSAPPLYAPLTVAFLAKRAGCTARFMTDLLADATERGLIECFDSKEAKRRGLDVKGHPQAKWWGACPEKWADAPPYVTAQPKLVLLPELDPDEEPEVDEDDDAPEGPEVQIEAVAPEKPLVLMPGKKSRPVAWVPTAKKYAFDCSEAPIALMIQREVSWNTVRFRIRQADAQALPPQGRNKSERDHPIGDSPLKSTSGVAGPEPLKSTSGVDSAWKSGKAIILNELSNFCNPDDKAVSQLIRDCRRIVADATFDEIAYFIGEKGPRARRKENPTGFLLTAVPPCFEGESFRRVRRALAHRGAAAANPPDSTAQPTPEEIRDAREVLNHRDEWKNPGMIEWAEGVIRRAS